jgi:2-isopropylmalate synthase
MMRVSHALAELANLPPNTHQAYVGASAFAHKAGLHASAIKVDPELYNHLDPVVVGNDMHILITEMAGRASVELKARELGVDLTDRPDVVGRVVDEVKTREAAGFSYEAADASFELLLREQIAAAADMPSELPFVLESYRVIVENVAGVVQSEATVKVHIGGRRVIATAEGNGPVNALDSALRSAVSDHLPQLNGVELVDYKVRILSGRSGTESVTRVLVTSLAGEKDWTTVGVHANVVEASWQALVDSLIFALGPVAAAAG